MRKPTMQVCAQPGCPELTTSSRCPDHTPKPYSGSTRRHRLPPNWPTLRAAILRRDQHRCYLCGQPANEVDHIEAGDNHTPNNLAAICTTCHRTKTGREGAAVSNRRRAFDG